MREQAGGDRYGEEQAGEEDERHSDLLGSEVAARVVEGAEGQEVIVTRVDSRDGGLRALQLRLAQFHDGTKTELVTRLREREGLGGLVLKLIGDRDAAEGRLRVEDGDANVAGDAGGEILGLLLGGLLAEMRFLRLGVDTEAGKEWEGEVHSTGGVPIRIEDSVWRNGGDATKG